MAEVQLRWRDDAVVDEIPASFAEFTAQDSGAGNAGAVRIMPGEDARVLIPALARLRLVEVVFPSFVDGRGLSAARILREAGYSGELRATGDLGVDQLAAMRRCGFDAFAPDVAFAPADAQAALTRWPQAYQVAADDRAPIWALRHAVTTGG